MMPNKQSTGKTLALAATVAGLLAASLKRRDITEALHALHPKTPVSPHALSFADWKAVLVATQAALARKNLPTLGAGVAYYSTLAFFPGVAAAVAIAALLITPAQLETRVATSEVYLPADVSSVVTTQLQNLVDRRTDNVLAAVIALGIALFGASGASKNLIIASNAAYGVRETRGWLAQQFWGILWTVAGIVFGLIVLGLLAVNSTVLSHLGIPEGLAMVIGYGRWPLALILTALGLAVFYRYGPDRPRVGWRWVSWGAGIATLSWLVATSAFFAYVQNFANYTQSYSLFAGIIVLMVWLNLSALIALVGVEINVQLEAIGQKRAS